MSLQIAASVMTSDTTTATATRFDAALGLWTVSWLWSRALDHDEAITALMLAEAVQRGIPGTSSGWVMMQPLARDLGMSVAEAVETLHGST